MHEEDETLLARGLVELDERFDGCGADAVGHESSMALTTLRKEV